MPRKYTKKKKATKRKAYRRKKTSPRRGLTLSGFPSKKLVKLRYVETDLTLDASASLTDMNVYRANSLYDPNYSGIGHQPMGFDQWANIYNRYTVKGAKITVTYTRTGTGNVNPSYLGITLSSDTDPLSGYTTLNNILESKLTVKDPLVVGTTTNLGKSTYQNQVIKYFSAKKFFGVVDVEDGASYSALVSTNPAKDAYFGVWTASVDNNDPGIISCRVLIDYICEFREPKNLDGSG